MSTYLARTGRRVLALEALLRPPVNGGGVEALLLEVFIGGNDFLLLFKLAVEIGDVVLARDGGGGGGVKLEDEFDSAYIKIILNQ